MKYTKEQLIEMHEKEIERLHRYFDKPNPVTIERIKKEIKNLQNQK